MRQPPSSCEQRSAWRPSVKYYYSVRIYHVTNKAIKDAFVWSLSLSNCIWPWLIFCGQKWFFGELWWNSKLFCEQLLLTYSSLVQLMRSRLKCQFPIQLHFWVSWDDFEWTDKNSHLRPNNLTGVRKSQTIKDERGMCECGNLRNPLQTVVLFLLTLVIWSCSVSWLLSFGLLDLSPSQILKTIFTCWLDLLSKPFLNSNS